MHNVSRITIRCVWISQISFFHDCSHAVFYSSYVLLSILVQLVFTFSFARSTGKALAVMPEARAGYEKRRYIVIGWGRGKWPWPDIIFSFSWLSNTFLVYPSNRPGLWQGIWRKPRRCQWRPLSNR